LASFASGHQELAANKKPPAHQGGGLSINRGEFSVSVISRCTSNQKHSFLIQGTLRLHRRLPDLLSEVIIDVR